MNEPPKIQQRQLTGHKEEKGKLDHSLIISTEGFDDVTRVAEFGAEKYPPQNYKKVHHLKYLKAILRHAFAIFRGEYLDPETGLPHYAHIAAGAIFAASSVVYERDKALRQLCDSINNPKKDKIQDKASFPFSI